MLLASARLLGRPCQGSVLCTRPSWHRPRTGRPRAAASVRTAASLDTLRGEIAAAIAVGAPLYNRGRPGDCFAVYRGAAQRLAGSRETGAAAAQILRAALIESDPASRTDPAAAAWVLRRAFDQILEGRFEDMPASAPPTEPLPPGAAGLPVLDCAGGLPADAPKWQILDDVVMGGASRSQVAWSPEESALVFSGTVTTAFNGGFASVRSLPWDRWEDLARCRGVRLLVRGDGRTYKLNLKTDDSWDGVAWQADFIAPAMAAPGNAGGGGGDRGGGWHEVDLPFSDFLPSLRGRVVSGQPPLQGQRVRQVGFMVSKFSAAGGVVPGFTEGEFRLAVRAVKGLA